MRMGLSSNHRAIGRRGAAAVEFAATLPLLTLLVLGCVDLGRFGYSYIAVTNAARAGASYGIMNNYSPSTLATWQANVIAAGTAETKNSAGTQTMPGLTVATPTVVVESATGLRRVQVTASYSFQTVVAWPGIPRTLNLRRTAEMRLIR